MTSPEVPPPEFDDLPPWADDSLAISEEKNFPDEKALQGQRRANDKIWLICYGWIVVTLTIVFAMLFAGSLVAWSFHYLTPSDWHWLDGPQLSKIQSIIFSGSLGGILSIIVQKQLSKSN